MSVNEQNTSVMIVEDDQTIARLLSHTLSHRGFSVKVASNGRDAVEAIETVEPPNLILLDLILPFADGFELLKKIRSTPNWEKIPIIMLTSKTQENSVVRAFDSGVDDYITKPFQIEELMVRVRRVLK